MSNIFPQFLLTVVFLTIIFLHIAKKNTDAVIAYGIQSLAIIVLLLSGFFSIPDNPGLLLVVILMLAVKVIAAPMFFMKLIRKHELTFSGSTYLNMPLTLLALTALTMIGHSAKFAPITDIIPAHQASLALALSAMLISLFLIVNRKGALSQIIGVLSLENSIVAFAVFAGLEQLPSLQIGIIFDIFVWLIVATTFLSMIYKHFGSLDVTSMKGLKD